MFIQVLYHRTKRKSTIFSYELLLGPGKREVSVFGRRGTMVLLPGAGNGTLLRGHTDAKTHFSDRAAIHGAKPRSYAGTPGLPIAFVWFELLVCTGSGCLTAGSLQPLQCLSLSIPPYSKSAQTFISPHWDILPGLVMCVSCML